MMISPTESNCRVQSHQVYCVEPFTTRYSVWVGARPEAEPLVSSAAKQLFIAGTKFQIVISDKPDGDVVAL